MAQAALGLWIMTMFGGAYMISFTTGIGRPDSTARATALPPLVTFLHPLLALTGLATWIAFLNDHSAYLAWIGVGFLLSTAALGDVLALRTARPKPEQVRLGPGREPADFERAEKQIPHAAIVVHGVLAVTTIVLAVIAAIDAS